MLPRGCLNVNDTIRVKHLEQYMAHGRHLISVYYYLLKILIFNE